jgi:CrcB protein
MLNTILVMAGGAIGSALRYQFGLLNKHWFAGDWPWGTLGVNVIGGLAMGLFAGWAAAQALSTSQFGSEQLRLFFAVGMLGGFTTFSAFSLETMQMIERGQLIAACAYVGVSVIASIGALAIGLRLAKAAV